MKFQMVKVSIFALLAAVVLISCGKSSTSLSGTPTFNQVVYPGTTFSTYAQQQNYDDGANSCMIWVQYMSGSTVNGSTLNFYNVACPSNINATTGASFISQNTAVVSLNLAASGSSWVVYSSNQNKPFGQVNSTSGNYTLDSLCQFGNTSTPNCTATFNSNGGFQSIQ